MGSPTETILTDYRLSVFSLASANPAGSIGHPFLWSSHKKKDGAPAKDEDNGSGPKPIGNKLLIPLFLFLTGQ